MTEEAVLDAGATFPGFTLPSNGGGETALTDLKGAAAVIFFYPKDDTKGCTQEAIEFTERAEAFKATGVAVFGVSKDPVTKHDKFIAKHDLGVALLSDENSDLCERCGVWVEKSMYGKKYMGIERSTFLIDGEGVVRQAWRKVKVPGHAEAVLKAAQAL